MSGLVWIVPPAPIRPSTFERIVCGSERSGTGSAPAKLGGGELAGDDGFAVSLLSKEAAAAWTGRTVRKVEAVSSMSRKPFRTFVANFECFPGTQSLTIQSCEEETSR